MPWLKAIPAALKLVPSWVWYLLLGAIACHFALAWHAGKVRAHDQAVIAARDAQWQKRLDSEHAAAISYRTKYEQAQAELSQTLKEKHDAQVRSNASDASDLRLRGPGKAAAPDCGPGYHPSPPAAVVRPERDTAGADVAAGQVPSADGVAGVPVAAGSTVRDQSFAIVPWSWLVDRAQEFDNLLDEVKTDHEWHRQHEAEWEKMRAGKP
jgi:hypothetical protein